MNQMARKVDELLEQAIINIEEDRAYINKLLTDLIIEMAKQGDTAHTTSGDIAARYTETLQRSNEQLVKIVAILHKEKAIGRGLSSEDKDRIYDMIKGN